MRYKKRIIVVLLTSIVMFGVGVFLGMPDKIGLCFVDDIYYDTRCMTKYAGAIAQPILFFSLSLLITCIILLFTSEKTYLSWQRFAKWAIPIGAVILFLAPADSAGGWISGGEFTKETASWGVAILFLALSLFVIIRSTFRSRR